VLGAAVVLASSSAFAAPQCNSRDKVLELLSEKYSEAPVAMARNESIDRRRATQISLPSKLRYENLKH
jgi:hypothetical protein